MRYSVVLIHLFLSIRKGNAQACPGPYWETIDLGILFSELYGGYFKQIFTAVGVNSGKVNIHHFQRHWPE